MVVKKFGKAVPAAVSVNAGRVIMNDPRGPGMEIQYASTDRKQYRIFLCVEAISDLYDLLHGMKTGTLRPPSS